MKNKPLNLTSDTDEIAAAMQATYAYRKKWIFEKSPSIGEILAKFPKFVDLPFLVRKFKLIHGVFTFSVF